MKKCIMLLLLSINLFAYQDVVDESLKLAQDMGVVNEDTVITLGMIYQMVHEDNYPIYHEYKWYWRDSLNVIISYNQRPDYYMFMFEKCVNYHELEPGQVVPPPWSFPFTYEKILRRLTIEMFDLINGTIIL